MSLLFSFYGDDFTGSTDALEALAGNGVRTALFLGAPEHDHLMRFPDYQAIGIAGESRSRDPEWMRRSLPPLFRFLKHLGSPITQYKVCSTFDSSPEIGNIGVAMQVGRDVFGCRCVPVVVAASHLRRYVLFGNLFAGQGDAVYRIDRHPTMRCHPVTPMRESDLRLHLGEQTTDKVECFDLLSLTGAGRDAAFDRLLATEPDAVVFDGLDEASELATGRLLWARREQHPFVAGSSGFTLAMIRHWRETGLIPCETPVTHARPVDRLIAVSGSCSPVTEAQIRFALGDGFEGLALPSLTPDELLCRALDALARGKSVIVCSALGPGDRRVSLSGEELGRHLGRMLFDLVIRSGVRRAVIAGGDTSSHAATQLGIYALTFAAPLAPGAPLCRAHSDNSLMDGLELVLKGGQVGKNNFFTQARQGQI